MTEPNLRFPAVFCENLRFSAKIRGFLRFPAPSKCLNFQAKGWICENLRFSAKICVFGFLCHLGSVTLLFAPKFLQINSPPGFFFVIFFCNFYGNSLRPPIFSVTLTRSSGSRVDWKIFFVIFTKLIPRKNFFCIAKVLVLMVSWFRPEFLSRDFKMSLLASWAVQLAHNTNRNVFFSHESQREGALVY